MVSADRMAGRTGLAWVASPAVGHVALVVVLECRAVADVRQAVVLQAGWGCAGKVENLLGPVA